MGPMKRREFITILSGTAMALPFAARAQQAIPVVGYLRSTSATPFESLDAAFRAGLKEAGFVDGQNVTILSRFGDNQLGRLPALVTDLVRLRAAVIATNSLGAVAAK